MRDSSNNYCKAYSPWNDEVRSKKVGLFGPCHKEDGFCGNHIETTMKSYDKYCKLFYPKAGGCKSLELANRCELTWDQFRNHCALLINQKLLIPSNHGPSKHYEITPKGERYLQFSKK